MTCFFFTHESGPETWEQYTLLNFRTCFSEYNPHINNFIVMYLILWTSMKFNNSMWQYDVRRNDITVHEAWYHSNTRHIIVRFTCVHMWPFLDGMNLDHNLVFVWLTYRCPCQITLCSAGTSLELLCNKYPDYNTYYWV